MISNLQYITQGDTIAEHLQNMEKVLQNGGDWAQLRLKEVTEEAYKEAALQAREICDRYSAKLVINDNVSVALHCKADGLHLGKKDMDVLEARELLPENMFIGGTANNLEDCLNLIEKSIDYIGLGPYRFTTTKKNLSPILGVGGYQELLDVFRERNIKTPIVAIGGITEKDVIGIRNTGVLGIAVSGLLTHNKTLKNSIVALKKDLK